MPTERVEFMGHSGEVLAARLDLPDGPLLTCAIFAHCFTCSKDIPAARRIAARLSAMGIAVLRFDFTGLGHSKGEFANTNFTSNINDLTLAAQFMSERGTPPELLIGHSLGGAAVIRAAGDIPSVKAVATIGAPYDPEHVSNNFGQAIDTIDETGSAEVNLGGRPFTIKKQFLDDIRTESLTESLGKLKRALLVVHSPVDQIVGIENATQIFVHAKHPKSFVSLDNADHLVSRPEDAEFIGDVISAWLQRYIYLPEPTLDASTPEGVVRVSEVDPDGFTQDVQAGPHHHVLADEPIDFGGKNLGMSPYGFLAAGLGACTSMTIRMYARRKKLPLTHVSVDVVHQKSHEKDMADGQGHVDKFTRYISLEGDLNADQRQRMLEIADKCPVHRTLERQAKIVTELVGTD